MSGDSANIEMERESENEAAPLKILIPVYMFSSLLSFSGDSLFHPDFKAILSNIFSETSKYWTKPLLF